MDTFGEGSLDLSESDVVVELLGDFSNFLGTFGETERNLSSATAKQSLLMVRDLRLISATE